MLSPIVCHLGALEVRWYGVCAAAAVLCGYVFTARRAPRYGLNANSAADLIMACVVSGLVGARLEYVRRFWGEFFAHDFAGIFRVWEGGLVFQGGFILALVVVYVMCRIRHWRLGDVGDLLAPVIPVGHAVSRIGCLMNGCCFGCVWDGPFAVRYPAVGNDVLHTQITNGLLPESAAETLPVFPVQALETIVCLAIAGVVLWLERRKWIAHQRFTVYMLLYAIGRFGIEFLRGDYHQTHGLTPAQIICVAIILPLTAAVIAFSVWRQRRIGNDA